MVRLGVGAGVGGALVLGAVGAGLAYNYEEDLLAKMNEKKWILPLTFGLVGMGSAAALEIIYKLA